jgi:hypothetical protein
VRFEITLDCPDPESLALFWAAVVGSTSVERSGQYVKVRPPADVSPVPLVLQRVAEPKVGKARVHLDLYLPPEQLDEEVARIEQLGATRLSAEPIAEGGCTWYVMADPAGNEFCICA